MSTIFKPVEELANKGIALRLYRMKRIKDNPSLADEILGDADLENDATTKKMYDDLKVT